MKKEKVFERMSQVGVQEMDGEFGDGGHRGPASM